jgi:hypothetical protein
MLTSFILIFEALLIVLFTLKNTLFINLVILLCILHPSVGEKLILILSYFFISDTKLNKNFVELKLPLGKNISIEFYRHLSNINQHHPRIFKASLKAKIADAYSSSTKLPNTLNIYINLVEKIKNIITWYDKSKSTLFLFYVLLIWLAVNTLSLKLILLYSVLSVFIFNFRAFRRYKKHNE